MVVSTRGVATKFPLGGGIATGGTDLCESKQPTLEIYFSKDFVHFIFGNIGKLKDFGIYSENVIYRITISGDVPPEPGAHVPHTPGGDAHGVHHRFTFRLPSAFHLHIKVINFLEMFPKHHFVERLCHVPLVRRVPSVIRNVVPLRCRC